MDISVTSPVMGTDGASAVVFGRQIIGALKTDDSSGSLSYAVAKATLQVSRNTLSVETQGLPDSSTAVIKNMAGQTLTAETAKNFGEGIGNCLKWVAENAAKGDVAPAPLFQSTPSYDEMPSVCFALGQIAEGNSLEEAIETLGNYHVRASTRETYAPVESVIVAAIYHRFKVTTTPTAIQRRQADELLSGSAATPPANNAQKAFYKAVTPYVTAEGAIASLTHLAGPARVKANAWPPTKLTTPRTQIGNEDLNFQAALNIGLGLLGDVHLGGDLRFCGFRSWSTYQQSGLADTIILKEFYGSGIRASIRYSGSAVSGGATQVAAKVTLEKTAASFNIDILGVDVGFLPSIGAFASGAATVFDSQTLSLIGGIWSEANAVITAHDSTDPGIPAAKKAAWQPCLTGVELNLGAEEIQSAAGRCGAWAFALYQLWKGHSREEVLSQVANADYKRAVEKVYEGITEPDSDARSRAKQMLRIGR